MFESAEIGSRVAPDEYARQLPELRAQLLQAQLAFAQGRRALIVITAGMDGAGKGEVIQCLNEWIDPRHVETHPFWRTSEEETERPAFWRFWRVLPPRGRLALFFAAWYAEPLVQRAYGRLKRRPFDVRLQRIARLEKLLADDGAVIIKFWFHLSKEAQRQRLQGLEENSIIHWRLMPTSWKHYKLYDQFAAAAERLIRATDAAHAPWHLIESVDACYRNLTTGQILLETLRRAAHHRSAAPAGPAPASPDVAPVPANHADLLGAVDLTQKLDKRDYTRRLEKFQRKVNRLTWKAFKKARATVIVFEGWDAAGKGSALRRLTAAMDARLYRVIPVAAPTDEERARHYLWRFWRQLPRDGQVALFDRSWYGRVLVERVEGFASPAEWARAYAEINDFEEQLVEHGVVLIKFWIHLSQDEQLRRFRARAATPYKRHKITPEDWRNRRKWRAYEAAVNEMLARTSTALAPWTLVAGNDKRFARVQILQTVCQRLKQAL